MVLLQYAQTEEDLREQLLALKAEVRKQEDEKDAAIREVAKLTRDIDIVEGKPMYINTVL